MEWEEEMLLLRSEFRFICNTGRRCFSIESSRCSRFIIGSFVIELDSRNRLILKRNPSLPIFVVHEGYAVVVVSSVALVYHSFVLHDLVHSQSMVVTKTKNDFESNLDEKITFFNCPSIRSNASNISRYFLFLRV